MKLVTTLSTYLFLAITFSACKQNKIIEAPNDANENRSGYFIVGEGGGFTGLYEQYKIKQNGDIEAYDFNTEAYTLIKKVKESDVEVFFTQIEELNLAEVEVNIPGNMSQYIEINYNGIDEHIITWELGSRSIDADVQAFFKESFSFCERFKE